MDTVKINIKTGSIGPASDPYGCETLTVNRGDHTAVWYQNGLGMCSMELWDRERLVRAERWHEPFEKWAAWPKETRNISCLCEMLFRRWVGMSVQEAQNEYGRTYRDDPYGPLSRYV